MSLLFLFLYVHFLGAWLGIATFLKWADKNLTMSKALYASFDFLFLRMWRKP